MLTQFILTKPQLGYIFSQPSILQLNNNSKNYQQGILWAVFSPAWDFRAGLEPARKSVDTKSKAGLKLAPTR
jgi:hypothetical protein